MNMCEANIVNTQFEMLAMLHDSHRICLHVELVGERALELLLVSDKNTITEYTPFA